MEGRVLMVWVAKISKKHDCVNGEWHIYEEDHDS